jgi:hypothetical protein
MDGIERHASMDDESVDVNNLGPAFYDDEPTEEDCKSLQRIADQLPRSVWYYSPCQAIKVNAIQDIY